MSDSGALKEIVFEIVGCPSQKSSSDKSMNTKLGERER